MLKSIVRGMLVALIAMSFMSVSAMADVGKGQKLFIKELKGPCGYSGAVMAKQYKQAKWKAIQEAGKLNEEIIKFCPNAKPLKDKYIEHVYDFLYNYASDSGNVPSC